MSTSIFICIIIVREYPAVLHVEIHWYAAHSKMPLQSITFLERHVTLRMCIGILKVGASLHISLLH